MFVEAHDSGSGHAVPGGTAGALARSGDDAWNPAELDEVADELAATERRWAELARSVGHLDRRGDWRADGAVSTAAWLRHRLRLGPGDAARIVRTGRLLDDVPVLAAAAVAGRLSAGQLGAVRRVVTSVRHARFVADAEWLVPLLEPLTLPQTEQALARWAVIADALDDPPPPHEPDRAWTVYRLGDGTAIGKLLADPALLAQLDQAIQTARTFDGPDDDRSPARRDADALAAIVAFFNANHAGDGTPRHRPHVELHLHVHDVDAQPASTEAALPAPTPAPAARTRGGELAPDLLCDATAGAPLQATCVVHETLPIGDITPPVVTTSRGLALPSSATEAFLCDCVLHRVVQAESTVLDYGRATRSVPLHLFRAVAARDGGCRFPGCDRPVAWCDAHHIRWWRRHGETKLDNLLLLCAHHHHLIHRAGWQVRLDADATVHVDTPAGRQLTSRPHHLPDRIGPPHDPPPG